MSPMIFFLQCKGIESRTNATWNSYLCDKRFSMRLIQVTASKGWRGHEQKIIYLYEAFRDFGYVEDQWIVCTKDSEIHKVAKSKDMKVIGLDFKSEYDLKFAKNLKKIADENRADIVFIHNSESHTISVLASLIYGLKIPLV